MFNSPFSFDGRIRRSEYGVSVIIYTIAYVIIMGLSSSTDNSGSGSFVLLFFIPMIWFIWAQGAKRCHDLGNSGWWQIIPFYCFWMLFQDSVTGTNEYGENPKGIGNLDEQNFATTQDPQLGSQDGQNINPQNRDL